MVAKKILKICLFASGIILLSAGCSLFQTTVVGGVAKSVNGGADWQFSNAIAGSKTSNLSDQNIAKLAFDPQNRQTVYVGTFNGGLFKSTDSGSNWTRILSKIFVYDFIVSPADSKIIYVAGSFNDRGKALKSADGGASWQEIYNDASLTNPVRAIALNPLALNQVVIGTDSGNLAESFDGGLSWKLLTNFNNKVMGLFWRPSGIYVLLKDKGLFLSNGSGASFAELTSTITKISPTDYIYSGPLVFNQAYVDSVSASLLYLTTSRGVYKSVDSGKTWNPIPLPVRQSDSNPRAIAVAQTSSNIVFTSVGPVVYKSTDGGQNWQTQTIATNGYINYILIDPQLPQIVYAGTYVAQ